MVLQHTEVYEAIVSGAIRRWSDPDPNVRQPHDDGLIVMGALIEKVDALTIEVKKGGGNGNGNGRRRGVKNRAKSAALPTAGSLGLTAFILELLSLFG